MIKRWSQNYNIGLKVFHTYPIIGKNDWANGCNWAKLNVPVIKKGEFHFIPSELQSSFNETNIDMVENMQWNSMEQFKMRAFTVYKVSLSIDNWLMSTCNCPKFFKEFKCEHVTGLAMRYKYCKAPLYAKSENVGKKLRKGRIPKAKKALIIQ